MTDKTADAGLIAIGLDDGIFVDRGVSNGKRIAAGGIDLRPEPSALRRFVEEPHADQLFAIIESLLARLGDADILVLKPIDLVANVLRSRR